MLTKSTLLAGLAALAAAAPTTNEGTIKLPISRRGPGHYRSNADGTVDLDSLLSSIDYTMSKYGATRSRAEKRAVVSQKLNDQVEQGSDIEYYGTVTVGSSTKQSFTIDYDTGSADFFVPGPSCGKSQGCVGTTKYSQKGVSEGNTTSVTYGSGAVKGNNYYDTVCIESLCAPHTNVVSLTQAQGFSTAESEGLMGFAFSTIANSKQPTFFERLIAQGSLTAPEFSFYLGRAASNTQGNSEITLGGADSSKYTGSLVSHTLNSRTYWQLPLKAVRAKGKAIAGTAGDAAIDTGTTVIIAPTVAATAIYTALGGFPLPLSSGSATETLYAYPCSAAPPKIVFDNNVYGIRAIDFNLGSVTTGLKTALTSEGGNLLDDLFDELTGAAQYCVGAIIGADINPGQELYVVGDTFLKNWYSVYNYSGKGSVSFAKAVI